MRKDHVLPGLAALQVALKAYSVHGLPAFQCSAELEEAGILLVFRAA